MDAENAITVENLTKVYDGFTLKDVSFKVPAGIHRRKRSGQEHDHQGPSGADTGR